MQQSGLQLCLCGPFCISARTAAADVSSLQVEEVMQDFAEPHGDRRQEIVFIGQDLDQVAISKVLDACLCNERDLRQVSFAQTGNWDNPLCCLSC